MKNILLPCLAAAALTLSFCFEQAPDASVSASTSSVPAAAEASLLSGLTSGEPATPLALKPTARAASRDSLAYGYYGQTLGLKFNHTENKSLLRSVTDWLGTPYSFGSNSRRGTDCSGFVSRVYQAVYGIKLRRSSRSMFGTVQRVAQADMRTGDLVFFSHGKARGIYHVGIYLKDGKFAHAACNGGVRISSLHENYYRRNFYAGGRVAGTQPTAEGAELPVITPEMLAIVGSVRPE